MKIIPGSSENIVSYFDGYSLFCLNPRCVQLRGQKRGGRCNRYIWKRRLVEWGKVKIMFGKTNIEIEGCGGKFNVRRCAVYEGQCRKISSIVRGVGIARVTEGLRLIIADE